MPRAVQQICRGNGAAGSQQIGRCRLRRRAVVDERLGHRITLAPPAIEDLPGSDEVSGL